MLSVESVEFGVGSKECEVGVQCETRSVKCSVECGVCGVSGVGGVGGVGEVSGVCGVCEVWRVKCGV